MTVLNPCPLCGTETVGRGSRKLCAACVENQRTVEMRQEDMPPAAGRRLSQDRVDELLLVEQAWETLPEDIRSAALLYVAQRSPEIAAALDALPTPPPAEGWQARVEARIDEHEANAALGRAWLRLDAVTRASSDHFSAEGLYRPECRECVRLFAERTAAWTLWNEVSEAARKRYAAKKEQK